MMEMEEEKEHILKRLGDSVRKVYGEWCSSPCRKVGHETVRGVVAGVDSAFAHGLKRPSDGYWPLLALLLDQDTRSHLLLYSCPKAKGWHWVVRSLARGELESLVTVVLAHLHLLPPLYLSHALLLDPSAQLVLPTLLAGLEHVKIPQSVEELLRYQPPDCSDLQTPVTPKDSTSINFRSLRASLLSSREKKNRQQSPLVRKELLPDLSLDQPLSSHKVLIHHHSGECLTTPLPAGQQPLVSATAPSPQFLFNVPQSHFPSLEPNFQHVHGFSNTTLRPSPHYDGKMNSVRGSEKSLDDTNCDIFGLSSHVIDTCREATEELNDQILEADEDAECEVQVQHFGKKRRLSSVLPTSSLTPLSESGHKTRESCSEQMSLEDELRAATGGGFSENRPPNALSDPDLIVGISGDQLVKMLPDVSVRERRCTSSASYVDNDSDELEVEVVEVFADRLVRRDRMHKLSASEQPQHPTSIGAIKPSSESCKQNGLELPKEILFTSKSKNFKVERKSTTRGSQQQLLEARQLLRSLTASGVLECTPELCKLLESLEQTEAMLLERSPPEGQEDPPELGIGSRHSLKKACCSSVQGPVAKSNLTVNFRDFEAGLKNTQCEPSVKSELLNTYDDKELLKFTLSGIDTAGSESELAIADDIGLGATTRAYATSCDELDESLESDQELNEHLAEAISDNDDREEDLVEASVCVASEFNADIAEELELEEDDSQLVTDADQSECRANMSCSSSYVESELSEEETDQQQGYVDQQGAVDGCCSTDDEAVYLNPHLKSKPDTLALSDSDREQTVSSRDESSDSDDHAEIEDSQNFLKQSFQDAITNSISYNRIPVVSMEESLCSLDEVNTEELALTESCREKKGIVGGTKWEELLGPGSNWVLDRQAKIVEVESEANTPRVPNVSLVNDCLANILELAPVVNVDALESGATDVVNLNEADKTELDSVEMNSKTACVIELPQCVLNKDYETEASETKHNLLQQIAAKDVECFVGDDYKMEVGGMTRTLSVSSCGSKSGDLGQKFDARSDGKLSSILDRLDCKLDNNSESVVLALDDAAREAQQQLLKLHTQLMIYRRMAARKKARKVIDGKVKSALRCTMLALKMTVNLPLSHIPYDVYPMKHQDVALEGCLACEDEERLERDDFDNFSSKIAAKSLEASQNVLSTSIFRRPGEKLCHVFMMREGHCRGVALPVRVVLSSHALYVLTTLPAPSLLHAMPYTQLHTVVLGATRDWVVVLSKGAVDSGGEVRGSVSKQSSSCTSTPVDASKPVSVRRQSVASSSHPAVGVQLCTADPDMTLEFVAALELQTRRMLMTVLAGEMKANCSENNALVTSCEKLCTDNILDCDLSASVTSCSSQFAECSMANTPMESGPSKRIPGFPVWPPQLSRGLKAHHFGLSDGIEAFVPCVVDSLTWEHSLLSRWLRHLMPNEICEPVLGSWLVDWDGGVRLGQSLSLGPTMEGPLYFRTTKLFSSWRQAHFLLKAGVLYQFWNSSDRLPHTMLDVTRCSACTPTTQHGKQHAFQVIQSDGSPLLLAACDAESAQHWIQALFAVISSTAGRVCLQRPVPCRLLLLPYSLVLVRQTDLLLAFSSLSSLNVYSPPPAPHPTPSQVPQGILTQSVSNPVLPSLETRPSTQRRTDEPGKLIRRDSSKSTASGVNAAGLPSTHNNLKGSRHLSSSTTSLGSNSGLNLGNPTATSIGLSKANSPASRNVPPIPGTVPQAFSNPPRTLELQSVMGSEPNISAKPVVADGSVYPSKLPLNCKAEVQLVSRLELRQLSYIARYSECSNTVILEVGSRNKDLAELGVTLSAGLSSPFSGDWALYFRSSKQLEHFLTSLATQVVVCERELTETSVQQFLLDGAHSAAGGWAAMHASQA